MEEQLVSFKTAKLAKEVGFNLCTYDSYDRDGNLRWHDPNPPNHNNMSSSGNVSAPTQGLLQKWLREEHNIHVWCEKQHKDVHQAYGYRIEEGIEHSSFTYNNWNYEEALERGLQKALKITKK